jgi:two-component system, OmpR family, phosphate regulon sensor histidine kinase PhoR
MYSWLQINHRWLQLLIASSLIIAWLSTSSILFGITMFFQIFLLFSTWPKNLFDSIPQERKTLTSNDNDSNDNDSNDNLSVLMKENLLIKNILNEIREGVVVVDKHSIVQFCNVSAKNILYQDILRQPITDLDVPKIIKKSYKKALKGEEIQIIWKKGIKPERRYYEITNIPSQREGFISIIRDITKVKRLERMKRDFIANVSHEIRTPLAIIQANTETLLDGAIHDEKFSVKFMTTIHRNARRMTHLVEELLDLSKIESGEFKLDLQQYYIYPLVHNILIDLNDEIKKKNHTLQVKIDMNIQGFFDQSAMKQIMTNYIINAIKYTPVDSTIEISALYQDDSEMLLFSVKDNGHGIPSKYHPRVFERFFRVDKGRSREEGGTGLGLAIVKNLAHLMNCPVGVENNSDGGAHFWCQMPKGAFGTDTEELLQAMQKDSFHSYDI